MEQKKDSLTLIILPDEPYVTKLGISAMRRRWSNYHHHPSYATWADHHPLLSTKYYGFAIDYAMLMLDFLQPKSVHVTTSTHFGHQDHKTGRVTGSVGLLYNGTADLSVPSWYMSYHRQQLVPFMLPPVMVVRNAIVTNPLQAPIRVPLLEPFPLSVWLIGLINLVIFGSILFFIKIRLQKSIAGSSLGSKPTLPNRPDDFKKKNDTVNLNACLNVLYGLLFQKSRVNFWGVHWTSGLSLISIWSLGSICGLRIYRTYLVSLYFTAGYITGPPFTNKHELCGILRKGQYRLITSEVGKIIYDQVLSDVDIDRSIRAGHSKMISGISEGDAYRQLLQHPGSINLADETFKAAWRTRRVAGRLYIQSLADSSFFFVSIPISPKRPDLVRRLALFSRRVATGGLHLPLLARYKRVVRLHRANHHLTQTQQNSTVQLLAIKSIVSLCLQIVITFMLILLAENIVHAWVTKVSVFEVNGVAACVKYALALYVILSSFYTKAVLRLWMLIIQAQKKDKTPRNQISNSTPNISSTSSNSNLPRS